jgi:dTDP-4-dehydrorhamnose reductase
MILIIGSNGQLGRQMQKALGKRGVSFSAYDYPDVDISQRAMLERLVEETKPHAVVNCAAYTNVNRAESDYDNAYGINALGPKHIARICNAGGSSSSISRRTMCSAANR